MFTSTWPPGRRISCKKRGQAQGKKPSYRRKHCNPKFCSVALPGATISSATDPQSQVGHGKDLTRKMKGLAALGSTAAYVASSARLRGVHSTAAGVRWPVNKSSHALHQMHETAVPCCCMQASLPSQTEAISQNLPERPLMKSTSCVFLLL